VLFDAGGPLVHLREPVGESYAPFARRHGARVPAWRVEDGFRRVLASAPAMVFPGRPIAETAELERLWWRERVRETFRATDQSLRLDDFEACFRSLWDHFSGPAAWQAAPGAERTLRTLRQRGLATGIVSNFDLRLPGLLVGLGLAPWLQVVALPAHAGAAKPDPRIFRYALAELGVPAHQALHAGDDTVQDVRGARSAGLRSVLLGSPATLRALPRRLEELALEPGA
jgi:putative hydrolase of the HAD superfamily